MRNLILEKDTSERSDTDRDDDQNDSSMYSLDAENYSREIVDLRQSLKDKMSKHEIFYSFEIVSMKKPSLFYQRLFRDMNEFSPLFYALTWHNKAASNNDSYLPLDLAVNLLPPNTLLHLAAKGLKRDNVVCILRKALASGIINIFVLQGDSLAEDGDFKYAADLVTFIREKFGDIFCICVAGYPQMHPKSVSKELDLYYLRMKVEAGADFIITQICFESQVFIDFVGDCRKIGIQIPIIFGLFTPTSFKCFEKTVHICKLDVPIKVKDDLTRIKDDDRAVREFAINLTMQIVTDIIRNTTTRGFHLFTLNRLSLVAEICKRIEFLKTEE